MRRGRPTPEEKKAFVARVRRMLEVDPGLSPAMIAERLQCSHVTVRRHLREMGLYIKRGASGSVLEARE